MNKNMLIGTLMIIICAFFVSGLSTSNFGNVVVKGYFNHSNETTIASFNNISSNYYCNKTVEGTQDVCKTITDLVGDTWSGNIDASGYSLTDLGGLVMSGLIQAYNITPTTTELYDLGNTTNWWNNAYIKNIYAKSINTTDITATDMFTDNLNASEINSTDINSDNIAVGENLSLGEFIIREDSSNLVIVLT